MPAAFGLCASMRACVRVCARSFMHEGGGLALHISKHFSHLLTLYHFSHLLTPYHTYSHLTPYHTYSHRITPHTVSHLLTHIAPTCTYQSYSHISHISHLLTPYHTYSRHLTLDAGWGSWPTAFIRAAGPGAAGAGAIRRGAGAELGVGVLAGGGGGAGAGGGGVGTLCSRFLRVLFREGVAVFHTPSHQAALDHPLPPPKILSPQRLHHPRLSLCWDLLLPRTPNPKPYPHHTTAGRPGPPPSAHYLRGLPGPGRVAAAAAAGAHSCWHRRGELLRTWPQHDLGGAVLAEGRCRTAEEGGWGEGGGTPCHTCCPPTSCRCWCWCPPSSYHIVGCCPPPHTHPSPHPS